VEKLYRFYEDCGRMGNLQGLFVADDEQDVAPAIGKSAYFRDVLGKHSEILIERLETRHFQVLTAEPDFVAKFKEYRCESGSNPLHHVRCPDCGDTLGSPYARCACGWATGS
jgi:hypothetical protein